MLIFNAVSLHAKFTSLSKLPPPSAMILLSRIGWPLTWICTQQIPKKKKKKKTWHYCYSFAGSISMYQFNRLNQFSFWSRWSLHHPLRPLLSMTSVNYIFFCCHWVWTKKKCRQQCLSAIPGQCKNLPFWNVTFHSAEPDKSRWVFFLLLFVPSYQPIAYQRCVYGSLSIRLEMLLLPNTRLCISCGIHAGAVLDYFISFRNGGLIIFIWAMAVCCPQIAVFTGECSCCCCFFLWTESGNKWWETSRLIHLSQPITVSMFIWLVPAMRCFVVVVWALFLRQMGLSSGVFTNLALAFL